MTASCIFLIDDHAMFRTGIRLVLQGALPEAVIREASSLEQAVRPPSAAPDLALLDIALEGVNGLEGIGLLRQRWPTTPIIMLSSSAEPETVRLALARGAAAFISKADTAVHIIEVVGRVLAGTLAAHDTKPDHAATLTPRQCEVLELLAEGLANKVIARRMQLSEFTVRGHVQAVLRILGVTSRSQAANAARSRGLLR